MQIHIEPSNGIPIYEQIVRQVKFAVAEKVALPGQVIPSVREMAKRLAVNPNTIQRAYVQLQDEQVLEALRGRGMVVSQNAMERCVRDRLHLLSERLSAVILEALQAGLSADRLNDLFQNALSSAQKSYVSSSEAAS